MPDPLPPNATQDQIVSAFSAIGSRVSQIVGEASAAKSQVVTLTAQNAELTTQLAAADPSALNAANATIAAVVAKLNEITALLG